MGSGIIYYEIEKREKYEDFDEMVDSDLVIVKTRRYYFDDEPFIHPLHGVRFDPDRPYELSVESLLAFKRREPSAKKDSTPRGSGSSRGANLDLHRHFRRRSFLPKTNRFEKWENLSRVGNSFCHPRVGCARAMMLRIKGKNVEKNGNAIGVREGEFKEEEEEEDEEDPEEDVPEEEMSAIPRPMDVDADEDYLRYLEDLRRHPVYSPLHSSQAFAQRPSDHALSQSSDAHSQPCYNLSGVWHLLLARVSSCLVRL
ncbi:hypothetical protein PIB30_018506 [Stylosanthes scabra]|uniref:Uncharacterized protein n=1 Tax=Stylosanthes scabra TaxID=79078 RepID=A0ABU6X5F4_9FABA|nr:hypothetical protein [Stylosanthes scabra]